MCTAVSVEEKQSLPRPAVQTYIRGSFVCCSRGDRVRGANSGSLLQKSSRRFVKSAFISASCLLTTTLA